MISRGTRRAPLVAMEIGLLLNFNRTVLKDGIKRFVL